MWLSSSTGTFHRKLLKPRSTPAPELKYRVFGINRANRRTNPLLNRLVWVSPKSAELRCNFGDLTGVAVVLIHAGLVHPVLVDIVDSVLKVVEVVPLPRSMT